VATVSLLRWVPLALVGGLSISVLAWVASRPISDAGASFYAFLLMCVLCIAAIPAVHLAADS
jgi:hypothetical protein